jgi:UrcA family protein
MNRFATACAAALGLMLASPALAESVEVHHADLDLKTPEGREELDRRINNAAREVCGLKEVRLGTKIRSREARQCVKDATLQLEDRLASLKGLKGDKAAG